MTLLVVLVSVLSIGLVGAAVIALVRPGMSLRSAAEWPGLLFAAGSVVVAEWGLAQVATLRVVHPLWVVAPALGVLAWRVRGCRLEPLRLPRWDRWHLLAATVGAVAAARLALGFLASLNDELGWDGLFIWGMKAKMLLTPELAYFTDPRLAYSHPDYPLLVPSLEAWTFHWAGSADLRAVKWISPFSLAMSSLGVYLGLRRFRGPLSSSLFALAVLVPVEAVAHLRQGYADLPLQAFFLGAVTYGCLYVHSLDRAHLPPMALFLAAMVLTKKEGSLLVLALLCGLVLSLLPHRVPHLWRAIRAGAILLLAAVGPWVAFQVWIRPLSHDFVGITPGSIMQAVRRVPEIAAGMKAELTAWERWGATWLALPLALLAFPDRLRRPETIFVVTVILAALVLYAVPYGFTAYPSPAAHMSSSLARLLLQSAPTALFGAGVVSADPAPKSTPKSRAVEGAEATEKAVR